MGGERVVRPIRVRAPGKLVILGEYAVLVAGEPAVVAAVDRGVEVVLRPATGGQIRLVGASGEVSRWVPTGHTVRVESRNPSLRWVETCLQTVAGYLHEMGMAMPSFQLAIQSELADSRGKYGLGSSAATAVAVIAAVLAAVAPPALPVDLRLLFKLVAWAHFQAQAGGSGIDVAAAVFGGWLRYTSAGPDWMGTAGRGSLAGPIHRPWPHLAARQLHPPTGLAMLVGYTGAPVATAPRLSQVRRWQETHPQAHARFLRRSRANVRALIRHWDALRVPASILSVAVGRRLLLTLGEEASLPMETPTAAKMHHLARLRGGAAKPSGAGGGDCSVAFLPVPDARPGLAAAWEGAGIEVLDLTLGGPGVRYCRA